MNPWLPAIAVWIGVIIGGFILAAFTALQKRIEQREADYLRKLGEYVNRIEAVKNDPTDQIRDMEIKELERLERL